MQMLRVGLFGLRGAGKTVALSVAYLIENCDGLELTVRDIQSIRYLRPLAETLERGEVPPPTMVAEPTRLKWSARLGETNYEMETIDFAGELLEVVGRTGDPIDDQMMERFRTQVCNWFVSCDAIVLFIDSTDPGTLRYRDALSRLLDEMTQRPTIRGSYERALVVVFTKADALAQTLEQLTGPEQIQRVLAQHPLYHVVRRRLEQHPERVCFRVFLSSALGWRFLTIPNCTRREVSPFNLFAAVRWGLEQAARIVQGLHSQILDELNEEIEERRNGLGGWVWALTNSRALHTMLEATDRVYQLARGPFAGEFVALKQRIQQARTRQLVGIFAGAIALLLVILAIVWSHLRDDQMTIYDAYGQMVKLENSEESIKERLLFYDENIHTRRWDWFWYLQRFRRAADAQAGQDAYLLWLAEDKRLQASGLHPQRYLNAKDCLAIRGSYMPERLVSEVRDVLEATEAAYTAERDVWNMISSLPIGNPAECEFKVRKLRDYMERKESLCRNKARDMLTLVLTTWDEHEYSQLAMLVQNLADQNYLANIELAARCYLREGRHTVYMREPVEHLVEQIMKIKSRKEFTVFVRRVIIPEGSDLDGDWRGNPNCSITLCVGSEIRQTRMVKPAARESDGSFTIYFDQELGPFYLTVGECKAATITVTTHRTIFPDNVASCTVTEETCPLVHLNGAVRVKCKANKNVIVNCDCPAARLSSLPPFNAPKS